MVTLSPELSVTLDELKTTEYEKQKKQNIVQKFVKRFFDILISLIGLIILIPLTLVIYIARTILHENDGPIFYEQLRIGKNGKKFKLYKFRTMVVGADDVLHKYLEENEEARKEFEATQKLTNDPRITRIGNFLRKTSIDEIPQFMNVLRGDMSLIGPRPLVVGELEAHRGDRSVYESVRPGITGWWAANGRSDTTYEERLALEYYYINNYSLLLDGKCMLKTAKAVICKTGAK